MKPDKKKGLIREREKELSLLKAKSKLDKKTAGNKKKTSPSLLIMVGYDDELPLILRA